MPASGVTTSCPSDRVIDSGEEWQRGMWRSGGSLTASRALDSALAAAGRRQCAEIGQGGRGDSDDNLATDDDRRCDDLLTAGAPTRSVPRFANGDRHAAARLVTEAMAWSRGIPSIRNFDTTVGRSNTRNVRPGAVMSEEIVSGQTPSLVAASPTGHVMCAVRPLPTSNRIPRARAARTSGSTRPAASSRLCGGGA